MTSIQKQANLHAQVSPDVIERLYHLAHRLGRAGGLEDVRRRPGCDHRDRWGGTGEHSAVRPLRRYALQSVARLIRHLSCCGRWAFALTPDVRDPSPIVVDDVLRDDSLAALQGVFQSESIRALAFIPLVYHGRLLGKFMLYYSRPHSLATEDLRLAATIADHVGFGVARARADAEIAAALNRERVARAEADAARAKAESASVAKDEFLAMLAHELRNPLGVIAVALTVLERTAPSDAEYVRSRAAIRRQTEH